MFLLTIHVQTNLLNWIILFINSFRNEGLSPSCIDLSFDGFGSISWHCIWYFRLFPTIFGLPIFFSGLSTTDETLVVEMRIWCIKIGNVFALHPTPPMSLVLVKDTGRDDCTCGHQAGSAAHLILRGNKQGYVKFRTGITTYRDSNKQGVPHT
jgi:hypothetical protein